MTNIQLVSVNDEVRVDSRLIADRLGIENRSAVQTITNYIDDFNEFGLIPFEMGKPKKSSKGGRPEKYYLLNEDQCYLLLTYSRNTQDARKLKVDLVKAFSNARNNVYKQNLLDVFLLPKPMTWEKRFDDEFYRALAKATNTVYAGHRFGTPAIYGQITLKWIYSVIMPKEVLDEVKARKSNSEKVHQWLQGGGIDLLDRQINAIKAIALTSLDHSDFDARCRQAFSKTGQLKFILPKAS